MATATAQKPPKTQSKPRCTYVGQITSPPDRTEVPFDQDIVITGRALKTCGSNPTQDVSSEIMWREHDGQFAAKGPSVTLNFKSRRNSRVALYVNSEDVAHIDLKIICDAIDPKSPPSNDQLALALIMFTEGRSCSEAEKEAIGACVINRTAYPSTFGSGIRGVIEKPGQFLAVKYRIYSNAVDDVNYIRDRFTYEEGMEFKPVLPIAARLLAQGPSVTPAGFSGPPFYFNRSANSGPAGSHSPRVHERGAGGFKHSFYGYDGKG